MNDNLIKELIKHKNAIEQIIYDIVSKDSTISVDIKQNHIEQWQLQDITEESKKSFECLYLQINKHI